MHLPAQPRDVANAALYLASDQGDFSTGAAVEVDGGRCIWGKARGVTRLTADFRARA
jgi:NAD(P)-dependent dehydrogenase (short-subunit alcohol dehydrogenase family)